MYDNKDGRIRGARGVAIRAAFLVKHPLCAECKRHKIVRPAEEVDHITPLHSGGKDTEDNKQALCKPCHLAKTLSEDGRNLRAQIFPEWLEPATCRLVIVFGPPASGKTTHVQEHRAPGDQVIDLDVIKAELSGLPLYADSPGSLDLAVRTRNRLLGGLSRSTTPAWFIVTGSGPQERVWWVDKLKPAETVVLKPDAHECIRRIRADPLRKAVADRQIKAVRQWFLAESRGWKQASAGGFDAQGWPLNARHQLNARLLKK